jgi:uncharacterized protein YndB with AHSA1/START domain
MTRTTFRPSPVGEVEYRADGDRWTLVLVRTLRHPPERVWAALTEPEHLEAWSPFLADRDLGRPGDATLTMIDGETREELPASVTRAERPTVLEYTWGDDVLRWELAPAESGTRLTLRHTVSDRDLLPQVAAGWHLCLDVAEHVLDGEQIAPIRGHDAMNYGWEELRDAYSRELGL